MPKNGSGNNLRRWVKSAQQNLAELQKAAEEERARALSDVSDDEEEDFEVNHNLNDSFRNPLYEGSGAVKRDPTPTVIHLEPDYNYEDSDIDPSEKGSESLLDMESETDDENFDDESSVDDESLFDASDAPVPEPAPPDSTTFFNMKPEQLLQRNVANRTQAQQDLQAKIAGSDPFLVLGHAINDSMPDRSKRVVKQLGDTRGFVDRLQKQRSVELFGQQLDLLHPLAVAAADQAFADYNALGPKMSEVDTSDPNALLTVESGGAQPSKAPLTLDEIKDHNRQVDQAQARFLALSHFESLVESLQAHSNNHDKLTADVYDQRIQAIEAEYLKSKGFEKTTFMGDEHAYKKRIEEHRKNDLFLQQLEMLKKYNSKKLEKWYSTKRYHVRGSFSSPSGMPGTNSEDRLKPWTTNIFGTSNKKGQVFITDKWVGEGADRYLRVVGQFDYNPHMIHLYTVHDKTNVANGELQKLNKQVQDFVTVALKDYSKGTQTNPINIYSEPEGKMPELEMSMALEFKRRAMESGKDLYIKNPDNPKGPLIKLTATVPLSDEEKQLFTSFGSKQGYRINGADQSQFEPIENSSAAMMLLGHTAEGKKWVKTWKGGEVGADGSVSPVGALPNGDQICAAVEESLGIPRYLKEDKNAKQKEAASHQLLDGAIAKANVGVAKTGPAPSPSRPGSGVP